MLTKISRCPHYSILFPRIYSNERSDVEAAVRRAHEAVIYLASLDHDRAMIANGCGFAKSDVRRGHNLARWPTGVVIKNPFLGVLAINLARKYRRQLPARLLVDQPDQTKLDL